MTSAPLRAHGTELYRLVSCLCCGRTGVPSGEAPIPRTWRWCQVGATAAGPVCEPCSSRAYRRGTDTAPAGIQPRDIDPVCPALEPKVARLQIVLLPIARPVTRVHRRTDPPPTTALRQPDPPTVIFASRMSAPRRSSTDLQERRLPPPAPAAIDNRAVWLVLIAALIALAALIWGA